jgi:hypothetical protein
MTLYTPQPIRPRPRLATTGYNGQVPCYYHHQPIYPDVNILRQRLSHKIALHRRPGSSFAPPRTAHTPPTHNEHFQHYAPTPFTQWHEADRYSPAAVSITDDDLSVESRDEIQHLTRRERTKVSFAAQVSVYEIPHRDSYQNKAALWTSQKEIKRQAARNTIEYAYEQFNWRTAVEKSQFLRLPTGQLVHPAHCIGSDMHSFLRAQYRNRQQEHRCKQHVIRQTVHNLAMESIEHALS